MACRMETRSRALAPSAVSALARSCTVAVAGSARAPRVSSVAVVVACRSTTVRALGFASRPTCGPGCEMTGAALTETCSPPWAMATGRMRTRSPATTVPVRSEITTRAPTSTSTSSASSLASSPTGSALKASGTVTSTAAESSALPAPSPIDPFTAAAMRLAVVKSGRRSPRTRVGPARLGVTARSTVAPPGTRPLVGVFLLTEEPAAERRSRPPAPRPGPPRRPARRRRSGA